MDDATTKQVTLYNMVISFSSLQFGIQTEKLKINLLGCSRQAVWARFFRLATASLLGSLNVHAASVSVRSSP